MPADFIAVANRRGGVGKTTITMMLAYGLAVVQGKRVLVVDLDSQASTTNVFVDRATWRRHQDLRKTIGHYLEKMVLGQQVNSAEFIAQNVGKLVQGRRILRQPIQALTNIDLVPSTSDLEGIETGLIISQFGQHPNLASLFQTLEERTMTLIRGLGPGYDIVLLDCPPGLSYLVWGALKAVDRIVIPFVPDATAEGNVRWLCQKLDERNVRADRRVVTNRFSNRPHQVGPKGAVEALCAPLGVHLPHSGALQKALELPLEPLTLAQRFGDANRQVRDLSTSVLEWITPA